jgi:hypothetical protein
MITAKTAISKIKSQLSKNERIQRNEWKREDIEKKKQIQRARIETLPSVLKEVEKEITKEIKNNQTSCYFHFLPWMAGVYLQDDVVKFLTKKGYKVEHSNHTPTSGGDPDSGEGAEVCGPTSYNIDISWDNDEKEEK